MKAILISIKPQYVAKILNGEKTIEIRKTKPKSDSPIDVYIYCSKDKHSELCYFESYGYKNTMVNHIHNLPKLNGKVVAKFTLNKVDKLFQAGTFFERYEEGKIILKNACLNIYEFEEYRKGKPVFAWHILNLVIFDEPRELREFRNAFKYKRVEKLFGDNRIKEDKRTRGIRQPVKGGYEYIYPLTKAPQSWCYVEELL